MIKLIKSEGSVTYLCPEGEGSKHWKHKSTWREFRKERKYKWKSNEYFAKSEDENFNPKIEVSSKTGFVSFLFWTLRKKHFIITHCK